MMNWSFKIINMIIYLPKDKKNKLKSITNKEK